MGRRARVPPCEGPARPPGGQGTGPSKTPSGPVLPLHITVGSGSRAAHLAGRPWPLGGGSSADSWAAEGRPRVLCWSHTLAPLRTWGPPSRAVRPCDCSASSQNRRVGSCSPRRRWLNTAVCRAVRRGGGVTRRPTVHRAAGWAREGGLGKGASSLSSGFPPRGTRGTSQVSSSSQSSGNVWVTHEEMETLAAPARTVSLALGLGPTPPGRGAGCGDLIKGEAGGSCGWLGLFSGWQFPGKEVRPRVAHVYTSVRV